MLHAVLCILYSSHCAPCGAPHLYSLLTSPHRNGHRSTTLTSFKPFQKLMLLLYCHKCGFVSCDCSNRHRLIAFCPFAFAVDLAHITAAVHSVRRRARIFHWLSRMNLRFIITIDEEGIGINSQCWLCSPFHKTDSAATIGENPKNKMCHIFAPCQAKELGSRPSTIRKATRVTVLSLQ